MNNPTMHPSPKLITAYNADIEDFAYFAYDRCVSWFGEPSDAKLPVDIVLGFPDRPSGCAYVFFLRKYMILIRNNSDENEFEAVGHELFHRVTTRRKGLHKNLWLEEVLAFLTSLKLMREYGFEDYANRMENSSYGKAGLAVDKYFLLEKRSWSWLLRRNVYPDGFVVTCVNVSVALNFLLDWRYLCHIVHCATWNQWLESLPLELRYPVCVLLKLDNRPDCKAALPSQYQQDETLFNDEIRYKLAVSMCLRGDNDYAIRELTELAPRNPENADIPYTLGVAWGKKGERTKMREAWQKSVAIASSPVHYRYLLANELLRAGQLEGAITEHRTVLQQEPHHLEARYYLSVALKKSGDKPTALQELEVLLRGEDADAANWARALLDFWEREGSQSSDRH